MGITSGARNYGDSVLKSGSLDMCELIRAAHMTGLPPLGHVDEGDLLSGRGDGRRGSRCDG